MKKIVSVFMRDIRASLDKQSVGGMGARANRLPNGRVTAADWTVPIEGPTLLVEFINRKIYNYYGYASLDLRGEATMTLTIGSTLHWTGKIDIWHRGVSEATSSVLSTRIVERLVADGVIPASSARR
jgi:hypothetical protein